MKPLHPHSSSRTFSFIDRIALFRQGAKAWFVNHELVTVLMTLNTVLGVCFCIGLMVVLDAPFARAFAYTSGVWLVSCVPIALLWSYSEMSGPWE